MPLRDLDGETQGASTDTRFALYTGAALNDVSFATRSNMHEDDDGIP